MLLKNIKGLKYPDEYMTRFFFKEGLNKRTGNVLELGCGNANNLSLFYQFGWDVTGVDLDKTAIDEGRVILGDFKTDLALNNGFELVADDMLNFLQDYASTPFDALVLASSIYYMERSKVVKLLQSIKERQIISSGTRVYIRMRKDDDYRFGKGENIGEKSFKLNISETGEMGCEMTFFSVDEFIDLINRNIPLTDIHTMNLHFDNYQNNIIIANSEMVIWGKSN